MIFAFDEHHEQRNLANDQQAQVLIDEAPPLAPGGEPCAIQQMGRCRLGGGAGGQLVRARFARPVAYIW